MTQKNPPSSGLLPIFLIVLIDVLALTIVIPLLPFYAQHFGASPAVVGSLITLFAACQLISGPILGRISDHVGRKPVLVLSQLGTCLGFLLMAYATNLPMLFAARALDGITAGNLSVAQATISDRTPPEKRAKSFALIGIAFGLGFLVGPAISGYLSQYGFTTPIFAAAGLSALSIVATLLLLPSARPIVQAGSRLKALNPVALMPYFKKPGLGVRLLQFLCFHLAFATFISGFALFAERRFVTANGEPWGPREVGYAFAVSGLVGAILQGGAIGKLVERFGEARLVATSFGVFSLGYAILSFSEGVALLGLAIVLTTFGHALIRPCLTSLVSRESAASEQGMTLGLTQSLNSVASIVTPMLSGVLIQSGMLTLWGLAAAVFAAVGAWIDPLRPRS